jgi:hypothetical protein
VDVIAAPDVFVNASVALGSPPEHAIRRVLGGKTPAKTSKWVLGRTEAMLSVAPGFKADAVAAQMATITKLTEVVDEEDFGPDDWKVALISAAKAAEVSRVLTDHPDLLELGSENGIDFVGTEDWLVERTMPPPSPS